MKFLLVGCAIMTLCGFAPLVMNKSRAMSWIAAIGVWAGCGLALGAVLPALMGNHPAPLQIAWNMPGGSLSFGMDALSAFFCLPILLVSPLLALYGHGYFADENHSQGAIAFFFNILVSSMLLVTASRNGLLFLVIWEIMALSSFFLVVTDHEQAHVRRAGLIYLVATHVGTAALLVFFVLLGKNAGSLDFDRISAAHLPVGAANAIFILAVIGFGTKAGFMPMHIWLPEAHPAAPSHVSALMSGVMIKTGIYGLLRALLFLGPPRAAWGWTLVAVGLVSGVLGVVFALAQHDIKRLLAYHSVENIGIIALGVGTGVLGLAWNMPPLVILGFGGGVLHVLNHAIFKSLLFMGAGAVVHGTGTRNIEHLGGLMKSMRWTGVTFLVASAAISGLPPFNGFVSEFLIYVAGIKSALHGSPGAILLGAGILSGLALIGGLAAACFAKAFGIIFLGEPRSEQAARVHEVGWAMRLPMAFLAVTCLGIGLAAPLMLKLVYPVVSLLNGTDGPSPIAFLSGDILSLTSIVKASLLLFALTGGFLLFRRYLSRGKQSPVTVTWDCGYARPAPSMQYTASSFSQPILNMFKTAPKSLRRRKPFREYFPEMKSFHTEARDIIYERVFDPLYRALVRAASPLLKLQYGSVHVYLLYIAITLIALLIFKAGLRK